MFDFTQTYAQGTEGWNKLPGSIVVTYHPIQPSIVNRIEDGTEPATAPDRQVELFGTGIRGAVEVARKLFKK